MCSPQSIPIILESGKVSFLVIPFVSVAELPPNHSSPKMSFVITSQETGHHDMSLPRPVDGNPITTIHETLYHRGNERSRKSDISHEPLAKGAYF